MLKGKFFSILTALTVIVLSYILYKGIFENAQLVTDSPAYYTIIAAILSVLGLFFILKIISPLKISNHLFLILIGVFTFAIRFLWVMIIDTQPVSDFFLYNDYAQNICKGLFKAYDPTYPIFPFKIGYSFIIAGIYKVFGISILYIKLLNVILSTLLMLIIYFILKELFEVRIARIGALIFALWPAQIMFCSVIASENIFVPLFTLVTLIIIKIQKNIGNKRVFILTISLGMTLAMAHFIRPVSYIIFPIFLIYLFFFVHSGKKLISSLCEKTLITGFFILSFILTFSIFNYYVLKATDVSMWKSSSGFSMLIGTNIEHSGKYNSSDVQIIEEFKDDYVQMHKEATRRAINRIKENPLGFLKVAENKLSFQWADESYGYYWSVVDSGSESNSVENARFKYKYFGLISQTYHILILFFSILGCFFGFKHRKYEFVIYMLIFLAFVGAHTFLEVQPRYQYAAMPFLVLIATYGIASTENIKTVFKTQKEIRSVQ